MPNVLTAGEVLVEIMRDNVGIGLDKTDIFKGPFASGAPAIFIDAVANLGQSAAIIGGVGDDDFGKLCAERLEKDGVDISGLNISKLTTAVAFVAYFNDGSRKFIYHIDKTAASDFGNLFNIELGKTKIFHVMGCSLMINETLANKILEIATSVKNYGGKVSFDPNIRVELMTKSYIKNVVKEITDLSDIVLPGLKELLLITNEDNKKDAIGRILNNSKLLVLKIGKEGCEIYSDELENPLTVPSFEINEIDPTGSGDAFDAGFICAYLEGRDLFECGVLANACGALNATRLGPMEGIFKREIIDYFIKNKTNFN